jgi:hypothetical protein
MKPLLVVALFVALAWDSFAQVSIRTTDLPSSVGAWRRAYSDTSGASVAARIGTTGGPQRWDFSQRAQTAETVYRIDIVGASDGTCASKSTAATYAERTTRENSGCSSWEYYSLEAGRGRVYYGMCDPCANSAGRGVVFAAATLELPDCTYRDAWERTVEWDDNLSTVLGDAEIAIRFTSQARVDAYGTVALPELGELPALRVNETNIYRTFLKDFGVQIDTQYFHNLYWLVPGIGRAVHIVSKASTDGPPALTSSPGNVLRVFDHSLKSRPVTNLAIQVVGPKLLLTWDSAGVGARYVIARGVPGAVTGSVGNRTQPIVPFNQPGLLGSALVGSNLALVREWKPVLTNVQNFVLMDIPLDPFAAFYRVGALP